MLYQDNYFAISVKLYFCKRQTHCIDDQDTFQSIKDTDNEFTECQTPRKKLQSIGISPVSLQLINDLKCTVQNMLMSLDTLVEYHMKPKSR